MKRLALLVAVTAVVSTPAFAGDRGGRCDVRHLAGEWLTAFEYGPGDEHDVACRLAIGRDGKIIRASCLQDTTTEKVATIGSFAVDQQCQFTGELTVGDVTFTMSGELADTRNLMFGLITQGDAFEPFTLIRSGNPSKGRPHKNWSPIRGPGKELELECVASGEGVGELKAEYEALTNKMKMDRKQFHAEFQAEGDGFAAGEEITLKVGGESVATAQLVAEDDKLEASFHFNTRSSSFPDGFPSVAEGTTVDVFKGDTALLGCALAKSD